MTDRLDAAARAFIDDRRRLDVGEFSLWCEARADLVKACLLDFYDAVDGALAIATGHGLVDEIGMDAVQAIMAEAFAKVPR